jgi:hypothetical protein
MKRRDKNAPGVNVRRARFFLSVARTGGPLPDGRLRPERDQSTGPFVFIVILIFIIKTSNFTAEGTESTDGKCYSRSGILPLVRTIQSGRMDAASTLAGSLVPKMRSRRDAPYRARANRKEDREPGAPLCKLPRLVRREDEAFGFEFRHERINRLLCRLV